MPRRSSSLLLLAGAAALAAGLGPFLEVPSAAQFFTFLGFVALAELLDVPLPHGASLPLGSAPALGFALLGHGAPEVYLCYLAGAASALVLRRFMRRSLAAEGIAIRGVVVAAAAGAYHGFAGADPFPSFGPEPISSLGFGAIVVLLLLGGTTLWTAVTVARERTRWAPTFVAELRGTAPVALSLASVAALLALAYPALRAWSLPLFLAPLAATEYSFRQFASMRRTYVQTIRALSTVPESAGYTEPGHSIRVAQLAVGIAHEMGLSRTDEIEYAALLHDIGRISLMDVGSPPRPREVATIGASIIEETGHFPGVADAIRTQHESYRRRGEDVNRSVPVSARIIRVASTYDDLTHPEGLGRSPWDALERMYLDMAYEYDPRVIQALTRVLEKHRVI